MQQITKVQPSSQATAPVELDFDQLEFVAGGLPKGTWCELLGLPKGTWEESLPKGTW
jgi:hypothetical protein